MLVVAIVAVPASVERSVIRSSEGCVQERRLAVGAAFTMKLELEGNQPMCWTSERRSTHRAISLVEHRRRQGSNDSHDQHRTRHSSTLGVEFLFLPLERA